jgi:hypothetical protein
VLNGVLEKIETEKKDGDLVKRRVQELADGFVRDHHLIEPTSNSKEA